MFYDPSKVLSRTQAEDAQISLAKAAGFGIFGAVLANSGYRLFDTLPAFVVYYVAIFYVLRTVTLFILTKNGRNFYRVYDFAANISTMTPAMGFGGWFFASLFKGKEAGAFGDGMFGTIFTLTLYGFWFWAPFMLFWCNFRFEDEEPYDSSEAAPLVQLTQDDTVKKD